MKRIALAAVIASLSVATAAPALADEYDDAVAAQVGKLLTFPQEAVDRQIAGQVGVKLDVDAQGHVTNIAIDNRSRSEILDRAALAAVRRAANSVQVGTGKAHTLYMQVNYNLN